MLDRVVSIRTVLAATFGLLLVLFAIGWATREDPDSKPYLQVVGGGFIFNYRVADVFYGFTAVVQRPLPTGTIVEAAFEDPAGGLPHVVRQRMAGAQMSRFAMRSPPVQGIEAGKPYEVVIRILDRDETSVLWSDRRVFRSQLDSGTAPREPLTVGPGYARPRPGGDPAPEREALPSMGESAH